MKDIYQEFISSVQSSPNKIAIHSGEGSISYLELHQSIERLTELLLNSGLNQYSKIGVVLENGLEYATLLMAAAKNNFILIPQSTDLPVKKLLKIFSDLRIDCLVASSSIIKTVKNYSVYFRTYSVDSQNVFDWIDEYSLCTKVEVTKENCPFIITLTSGSTGRPKPIVLTQNTKIQRIRSAQNLYNLSSNDVILVGTPMYHSLAQRLTLLPLFIGASCVILKKFSLNTWLEFVQKYSVSFTIAVASQLKQLTSEKTQKFNLDSLRTVVSSSELLPYKDKKNIADILDCDFHECYGASEVGIATNLSMQHSQNKDGSVGLSINGVNIKILIPDTDVEIERGKIGEICIKSIMEFDSYFEDPLLTKGSYSNGYFRTGDLGKVDKDGYLYFCGRIKDIIITGGINVYPQDIEEVIIKVSGVRECAVIGIPDASHGEVPIAVLTVHDGLFSLREVKLGCLENLSSSQIPRRFIIVDELAKNEVGKIQKKLVYEQIKSLK